MRTVHVRSFVLATAVALGLALGFTLTPLSAEDKEKLLSGNAKRLLKL